MFGPVAACTPAAVVVVAAVVAVVVAVAAVSQLAAACCMLTGTVRPALGSCPCGCRGWAPRRRSRLAATASICCARQQRLAAVGDPLIAAVSTVRSAVVVGAAAVGCLQLSVGAPVGTGGRNHASWVFYCARHPSPCRH